MDAFSTSKVFPMPQSGLTGSDFFPPYPTAQPPVLPQVKSSGAIGFCKNNAGTIAIMVLVIAMFVAGYMVWQARRKESCGGPFGREIAQIQEPGRREDMKEWQYMYMLARRESVKNMLREVLQANVASSGPMPTSSGPMPQTPPPQNDDTFTVVDGGASQADPNFTPA
jgi:hypothetical protein